jgi:hypothetical protein
VQQPMSARIQKVEALSRQCDALRERLLDEIDVAFRALDEDMRRWAYRTSGDQRAIMITTFYSAQQKKRLTLTEI